MCGSGTLLDDDLGESYQGFCSMGSTIPVSVDSLLGVGYSGSECNSTELGPSEINLFTSLSTGTCFTTANDTSYSISCTSSK